MPTAGNLTLRGRINAIGWTAGARARMGRARVAAVVVLGVAGAAWADTAADRQARLQAGWQLERPEGAGPFPAVMLLPNGHGFSAPEWRGAYEQVTRDLKADGFVVVRVDYLATTQEASSVTIFYPETVVPDIAATAAYLRSLPYVKPTAINALGWSFGGGMALLALAGAEGREPVALDAVVAYYPWLRTMGRWSGEVPVLLHCADLDDVAPCGHVEKMISEQPRHDRVQVLHYPQARHGFSNPGLPAQTNYESRTAGYDEVSARTAWSQTMSFLRR